MALRLTTRSVAVLATTTSLGGLGDDTISGGDGDDTIEAQAGDDIITTGAGSDIIYGGLGDDSITVDGTGNKTIDGGTGTNSLRFNYSGVSSVADISFSTIPTSDTTISLVDANGGTINFTNILDYTYTSGAAGYWEGSITVNSKAYTFVTDMRYDKTPFSGAYGSVQAFVYENPSNTVEVVLPNTGKWLPQYRMSNYRGFAFDGQETFTIYGGAGNEAIFGGYKADTITGGDGNDYIFGGDGADSINAGAGDDVVYTSVAGLTEDTSINGGAGSNTLVFDMPGESGGWDNESYGAVTFNLSSDLGNASNFVNVGGGGSADTLTGDTNNNVIIGAGGADKLYGGDGNDSLYGDEHPNDTNGTTYGIRQYSLSDGNDELYGGAGDDILYASDGDDKLDGGTGADTLTGGSGSNTFILRSGDGGSSQSAGDTITDFTDDSDSFGLDSLSFGSLTISQSGSDTTIKEGSNYLATLTGITASTVTAVDFQSTSTTALTLSGTTGDDTLIGGAGGDTFNAGAESDTLYGWGGDDTFNISSKSGSYTDTINGGTGTNVLNISYVNGLSDFSISMIPTSDTTISLVDANGGTINFTNILDYTYTSGAAGYWEGSITVNSKAYTFVTDMRYDKTPFSGAYGSVQAFVYENPSNTVEVVLPNTGKWLPQYRMSNYRGFAFDGQETFTIYGGAGNEAIFGGYKADTITGGDGNDYIFGGDGADSINAGAGDDVVYTSVAGLTEDTSINGGAGSNTLVFDMPGESGGWDNESYGAVTFNLSSDLGNASNFVNVGGGGSADTLTGDTNNNVIIGAGGADKLYGGDGNDSLYGDEHPNDTNGTTYGIRQYSLSDGNDELYGGAGDDILYASDGDDKLDGGTGADTLTGGSGSNTFILRSGDGGSSQSAGDTITDFTDDSDSFGLDSLSFGSLTISQSGSDTTIKEGSNYLATLTGITASTVTAVDFQSTSTTALTLSGTTGDDTLIGGAGGDTFNAGAESDTLYGWGGDDTFNISSKSGSYTDTINGGTGTNVLNISYVNGLSDFSISMIPTSDTTISLVDANGGTINFTNILDYTYTSGAAGYWEGSITVNSKAYTFVTDMRYDKTPFSGAYGSVQAFVYENPSNTVEVVLPNTGKWLPQYRMSNYRGFAFDGQETFTIYGGAGNEAIFGGYKADTITGGDGNDYIFGGDGADSINAGAGDDVVYTSVAGLTEDTSINGGAGSNTLVFDMPGESGGWDNESYGAVTFNLSSDLGNASNFVNVGGGGSADTLTGDTNNNVIIGAGGADKLYGGDGNDSLYGDEHPNDTNGTTYGIRQYSLSDGNDELYGGAGDDILYASDGDDKLDGGTGADTLTGGSGIDTFITRSGDGGSTISDADTITDFADGTDLVGLNGLSFGDLRISPGTGANSNDTIVEYGAEVLIVIQGISAGSITSADFTPI